MNITTYKMVYDKMDIFMPILPTIYCEVQCIQLYLTEIIVLP